MLKVFCAPARYTQGPHATEQLGAEIRIANRSISSSLCFGRV